MLRPLLRAALAAATLAVTLTAPAVPATAAPSDSPFRIQSVRVTYDPADPYHPVVTYRLRCALPKDSPLRSGTTVDSWMIVSQPGGAWWHNHGPYDVPRPYVCGQSYSFTMTTDRPDGSLATTGPARIRIRERILVDGTEVVERYEGTVVIRPARR